MDDEHMLTTEDNPYDPFTQYKAWDLWDQAKGYHTSAYLARVIVTSDDLTDAQQDRAMEDAIQEILTEAVSDVPYIRVSRSKAA